MSNTATEFSARRKLGRIRIGLMGVAKLRMDGPRVIPIPSVAMSGLAHKIVQVALGGGLPSTTRDWTLMAAKELIAPSASRNPRHALARAAEFLEHASKIWS